MTAYELRHGYSRGQRYLELLGIALFFALTAVVAARLFAMAEPSWHTAAYIAGAFLLGLLFSDFISGFVHWLADNWGNADWPLLGTGFIRPFRHHHVDPEEMTRHDFVELNGNNCIISLPMFWIGMPFSEGNVLAQIFSSVFCLSVAYWVLGTNQFHAWAHLAQPSPWIARLQRARLILAPEHHAVHHRPPHDRNYCITTGWMNAPLRWLRFFEIAESCVTFCTGHRPQHALHAARTRG